MKVLVKCATRVHGISKAKGKPYDFCQLETLIPAECVSSDGYNKVAYGRQDMQPLALDPVLLPFFAKIAADQFPIEVDVTIELRPLFGKYENTVVTASFPK